MKYIRTCYTALYVDGSAQRRRGDSQQNLPPPRQTAVEGSNLMPMKSMRNRRKFSLKLALAAFVFTAAAAFAQTTIFSDGFEGAFPGSWTVGNDGGITTAKWGDNSAKASAGSWSAFCADNGSDTRTVYDNNLVTYMQRQGVSLAGYTTATLSFKYWLNTESGFDKFTVNIRDQNGTWHAPEFTDSGNHSSLGWQPKTVNLDAYAGQTGLYIQFLFKSDGATVNASPSGVWVDEVSLVASASGTIRVTVNSSSGSTLSTSEMNAVILFGSTGSEVARKQPPTSNPMDFTSVNYDSYFVDVYCWDMLGAESSTFTHNSSLSTITLTTNPKRPLTVTAFYSDGTTRLPGATVYLDSWNGQFSSWTQRASATTDSSGMASFSAWPTTQTGEKYRIRVNNNGSQVGLRDPASVANIPIGSSYSITTSVTPPVQYGNISARLKKVDGTDAPVSAGTPRFKLYTSPNQILSGANPATFSNIPVGTYSLEGYQTGSFWGEEFWNSQQFTVAAGATLNAVLTRQYPYATQVTMTNAETGARILPGDTIPAGTQVRFGVTVRNDVPSTPLSTQVHFVLDLSQGGSFDYDWPLSPAQVIAGSGGTALYTFTTAINGFQTGQFYFALQVKTGIGANVVPTDSWTWTQACGIGRISTISGLIDPPSGFVTPTLVFIQRYPAGTTARIDPNLRTWIIIHGRNGSSTNQWVVDLAGAITNVYPSDQILLLDWSDAAHALDLPLPQTIQEDWIKPVATWAAGKLVDYGFAGSDLNLIGHSWGGNMTDELAERIFGGVNTIVALDPAHDGAGNYNPEDPGEIDFRGHSQFSWAFHSSLLGSSVTPTNAHEAFIVDTGLSLVLALPGVASAHSAVHDLFTYMLTNSGGGVSSKFQLSRLLAHQPGPWMPDLFTTSFDQGFPYTETPTIGYEGRIYAIVGGQSPYWLDYTNSSLQRVVVPEYVESIPPTISAFSASPNTATLGNAFTISYTVSDSGGSGLNRVVLRRTSGDGSANDPGWQAIQTNTVTGNGPVSWNFSDTPPSAGTYWYGAAAFDNANNSQDERAAGLGPLQRTVTPPTDIIPPTVSISSPTSGQTFTTSPVTVSGTATDPGSPSTGVSLVQVQVNGTGGTWQTASGTTSWSAAAALSSGTNTIYVRSQDGANNYSTIASVNVTYNPPDTQGPALTIISPANSATVTNASLPVNGTASDSGYGNNGISSVTVNGASASGGTASGSGTANWSATVTLNSGVNTITVVAKDTLNNSRQQQINVTYNPPRPVFGGSSVTGGKLKTTLTGLSVGEKIVFYMSTDLKNWSPIQTNIASGSTLSITNTINSALKGQFFRAVVQ